MVVFALVEEADNGERDEDAEADREESNRRLRFARGHLETSFLLSPWLRVGIALVLVYLSPLFRLFVTRHYFISPLFSSKRRCILSNER